MMSVRQSVVLCPPRKEMKWADIVTHQIHDDWLELFLERLRNDLLAQLAEFDDKNPHPITITLSVKQTMLQRSDQP